MEYTYDDLGGVTKEEYYENGSTTVSLTISYEYNSSGALATVKDSKTGITTKHYYDTVGRSTGMYESGGSSTHRLKYTYDGLGRLQKTTETCGNSTYTTEYGYYGDGKVGVIQAGSSIEKYEYDAYGRLDRWYTADTSSFNPSVSELNASNCLILKNIHYEAPDDRSTSSWPVVWSYTSGKYSVNYNYGYDANGNIVSEKVGGKTTTYVYDSANQLIRENNQAAGYIWVWTYDKAGNILSKKEYGYTTGALGNPDETYTYTYGNSNWGDLLTNYNGANITYDSIGNPLSDGTWTYTWQEGRKLASMSRGSTTWTYTYDANGMRTKRTNGSTTYNYIYHGDQLTHMTYGSNVLHFYYDASGKPLSVIYNGATYYYVLNLQGDVVALLDSSGNQVVGYSYDAWGNPLTLTGSKSSTLGLHNPLRYRGYVYDRETGLYYVSSRYYNPEIGRWINADSAISGVNGDILGYNMFAYCFNNPVNMSDPDGKWPFNFMEWFIKEFALDIMEDCINYDTNNESEQTVLDSNYFSNYKGVFVIRTPFDAPFSFGIIGMNRGVTDSNLLKHEYGHTLQLKEKGVPKYLSEVAIPSVTINVLQRLEKLPYDYYSYPWEAEANDLGKASLSEWGKSPLPENESCSWWDLIKLFFD